MKNDKSITGLIFIFVFLFLSILGSNNASAYDSSNIQVADIQEAAEREDDSSREGLEMVFGAIVRDPLATDSTGDSTMLASTFVILNGLALICGAFFIGYIVFRKVFQAGNDGKLFDTGNNNSFSILRYVWGFIALIPTASGWSMAQLVVLWSASLIGVGTANLATDAALDNWYEGGSMVLEPARPETIALASNLFDANLCAVGINTGVSAANAVGANLGADALITYQKITNTGFVLADSDSSHTCGGAKYPQESSPIESYWGASVDPEPYRDAQIAALNNMQSYLSESVQDYAEAVYARSNGVNVSVPVASRIIAAAARIYDQGLSTTSSLSSTEADKMREAVITTISNGGWWEIGGWYGSIAQANSIAASSTMDRAQAVGQSLNSEGAVSSYYSMLRGYTKKQKSNQTVNTDTSNTDTSDQSNTESSENSEDADKIIGEIFGSSLGQGITTWFTSQGKAENGVVNPIISMKSLGDNILVGTEASFTSYVGIKAAVGAAGGWSNSFIGKIFSVASGGAKDSVMGAAKAISDAISPFVVIAIVMLFGFGVTLSIYIPFIPFLVWFAAIINWVIFVAIGVVAAPLWAFAHLSGDENNGRSTHGYIFILNAMLRPVLMVVSFILAGGIVVMGGTMLNSMFGPALANAQQDSITGLVSIIGFLSIYISASLTLIHTSFNLIFQVPDKVMEWIGGSQLATGQGSERESEQSSKSLGVLVRDAGNKGSGMPQGRNGSGSKNSISES